MADFNNTTVSPVGALWRYIRNHYSGIELYDPDESHPSPAGSYAGACSFYSAIFKKSADLITYNFSLSAAVAANIRTAAIKVVYDSLSYWSINHYETIADFSHNANRTLRVSFTNKSANATRYHWDFGDGQTSTVADPIHTYTSERIHTVRLIATGASCSDTTYASINTVLDPNAAMFTITPNPATDKLYITPVLFGQDNYRIQVVNGMGQLVYDQRASGAATQTIEVLGLPRGIYIVSICTTRSVYRKKIFIR
jgi:PKD repeat protein